MSGSEYTLEELAADKSERNESTGDDSDGGGLSTLVDYMIENGYIDAMAHQQMGIDTESMPEPQPQTDGDSSDGEVTAETVVQFTEIIVDRFGDVPISQVGKYARNNPEEVNKALDELV